MRLLVLTLLLANLALWAFMEYLAPQGKPDVPAQQVSPEKMRLLSSTEIAQMPASSGPACVEFGPLKEDTFDLAEEKARSLQPGISLAERRTETGIFLELRAPSDNVRKQLSEFLTGVSAGICAS